MRNTVEFPGRVECPFKVFWQILKVRLSLFQYSGVWAWHQVGCLRQQFCQDDVTELLGMVIGIDKDTEIERDSKY